LKTTPAKGIIDIDGYMVELHDDQELVFQLIRKRELALFKLFHATKPTLLYCASGEESLQEWLNAILLEFSREYVRQSTIADFRALDENDIPDFESFRERKRSQRAVSEPDESDFYQELELEKVNIFLSLEPLPKRKRAREKEMA